MSKLRRLYIIGLIALAGIIIGLAWAEQISLSTYYPSPYGVYKQFRLEPRDDLDPSVACSDNGLLYFDDSDSELYCCKEGSWQTVSCPPPPSPPAAGGNWHPVGQSFPNIPVPGWSYGQYRLDLSPWVGAERTVVLLKVKSASSTYLFAKPFADTDLYDFRIVDHLNYVWSGDHNYKLMMLHTDDNGEIGLLCMVAVTSANWNVILVGYF